MTQFRKLQNGYLIAPKRGPNPIPPPGYEAAPGDPFVFLPILPICAHRERKIIQRKCCGSIERLHCTEVNGFVTRLLCQRCTLAKL